MDDNDCHRENKESIDTCMIILSTYLIVSVSLVTVYVKNIDDSK